MITQLVGPEKSYFVAIVGCQFVASVDGNLQPEEMCRSYDLGMPGGDHSARLRCPLDTTYCNTLYLEVGLVRAKQS
jgi:hypothetical protein